MKFLADMGISPKSVAFLDSLEHDAVHLYHQGLQRLPDPDILAKARSEQRVLLAHDLDFGDLMAASGATVPSVVLFRLSDMAPENVNRYLAIILAEHRDALEQGAILSVADSRIRVRLLPIGGRVD